MIIYSSTKKEFGKVDDIADLIESRILEKTGRRTPKNELDSFHHSLTFMQKVLNDDKIPDDCGVSIEYHIPQTSKRVDFIISGSDKKNDNIIVIELKQWQTCEKTDRDGIVRTYLGRGMNDANHPSYQAYTYACLIKGFNATIDDDDIGVYPCAYLHNYIADNVITDPFYKFYIEQAPLFFKSEIGKLRQFIKKFIKEGDFILILCSVLITER